MNSFNFSLFRPYLNEKWLRCGHFNGGMSKKSRDEDLSDPIVRLAYNNLLVKPAMTLGSLRDVQKQLAAILPIKSQTTIELTKVHFRLWT